MHPFVLIPLAACVTACAVAGAALGRSPHSARNRISAAVLVGMAFWAACEVAWNLAASPDRALFFARLASVGFMWFGPLGVHLHASVDREAVPRPLLRSLPLAYALCPLWIALYMGTDWFLPAMRPEPWGWTPVVGPGLAGTVIWVASYPTWLALEIGRGRRRGLSGDGPASLPWLLGGLVLLAVSTQLVLPLSGPHLPPVGSAVGGALSVGLLVGLYRLEHTVMNPRTLAAELVEAFPDGVALLGREGRIRSANANLARLAGMPRERLRGLAISRFLPDVELGVGGSVLDEQTRFVEQPGHEFPVQVSCSPLATRTGDVLGQVVAVRDLRPALQLRGRLVASGRLAAVGELAASITHEINNPISFVRTNLRLLDSHLDSVVKAATVLPGLEDLAAEAAEGKEMVADTLRGADRVVSIVRDVRSFSGAGHREAEMVDVNRLCEEALRVSLARIPTGVTVVRSLGELPPVPCAPRALVQVFLNLLTNAVQAVGPQGAIRIVTRAETDRVWVQVDDDGGGIAPDVLERIFDPFFTTKPVGEGTGLGLAISREIIEDHGGELVVESCDQGSSFRLWLPLELPLRPRDEVTE